MTRIVTVWSMSILLVPFAGCDRAPRLTVEDGNRTSLDTISLCVDTVLEIPLGGFEMGSGVSIVCRFPANRSRWSADSGIDYAARLNIFGRPENGARLALLRDMVHSERTLGARFDLDDTLHPRIIVFRNAIIRGGKLYDWVAERVPFTLRPWNDSTVWLVQWCNG